jgi:hypothetical protein
MVTLAQQYGELYLRLNDSIATGKPRSTACREDDERLLDQLEQRMDLRQI